MATPTLGDTSVVMGTENPDISSLPEGINCMESGGKMYIINEVLNFYQRKLSTLTIEAVRALAHHLFELDALREAKQLLLTLWKWKKCNPSSDNNYIIKGLEDRRQGKRNKTNTAMDIIKFLQVEDANLGIIFLTLKCELIPSKVHESEAMKDIYVLMHQSDDDHKALVEQLEEKSLEIQNYANMVTGLRDDMQSGFLALTKMIEERIYLPANIAATAPETNGTNTNNNDGQLNMDNQEAVVQENVNADIGIQAPVVGSEGPQRDEPAAAVQPAASEPVILPEANHEGRGEAEILLQNSASNANNDDVGVAQALASNDNTGDELEEGEIRENDDGINDISLDSFSYDVGDQQNTPNTQTWSVAGARRRLRQWFRSGQIRQRQQQQQQQQQQQ